MAVLLVDDPVSTHRRSVALVAWYLGSARDVQTIQAETVSSTSTLGIWGCKSTFKFETLLYHLMFKLHQRKRS